MTTFINIDSLNVSSNFTADADLNYNRSRPDRYLAWAYSSPQTINVDDISGISPHDTESELYNQDTDFRYFDGDEIEKARAAIAKMDGPQIHSRIQMRDGTKYNVTNTYDDLLIQLSNLPGVTMVKLEPSPTPQEPAGRPTQRLETPRLQS